MKRYPKITLKQFAQTVKTPVLSRFDNGVIRIYDYIEKMEYIEKDKSLIIHTYIWFKYDPGYNTLELNISNQLFADPVFASRYFQQADIATTAEDWSTIKGEMLRLMFNAKTKIKWVKK